MVFKILAFDFYVKKKRKVKTAVYLNESVS